MYNKITDAKPEDLKDIKEYMKEEAQFWNDIANGKTRFISPMSQYSENLYELLLVLNLPQADNGTVDAWVNHLSEVQGVFIDDDGDYRAHCTTCRELATDIVTAVEGYIDRETDQERNDRLQQINTEIYNISKDCTLDDPQIQRLNELQQEAHDLEEQNWKRLGDISQIV